MKFEVGDVYTNDESRSPCGERGLKYLPERQVRRIGWSLPVRGAWVEMSLVCFWVYPKTSLPVRGAWVEIPACIVLLKARNSSLPVRGAWVEISWPG